MNFTWMNILVTWFTISNEMINIQGYSGTKNLKTVYRGPPSNLLN